MNRGMLDNRTNTNADGMIRQIELISKGITAQNRKKSFLTRTNTKSNETKKNMSFGTD